MTPSGNIPTHSLPSNSVYNNLSSASGLAGMNAGQSMAPEMSPADNAITEIGSIIQSLETVSQSYPGIAESEKQAAMSAISKYMERVVGSLNSSPSAQQPMGGGLASMIGS